MLRALALTLHILAKLVHASFPNDNKHILFSAFGYDVHRGKSARSEDIVSCILEAAARHFEGTGAEIRLYASQVNSWRAKDWELFEKHGIKIEYYHLDAESTFKETPLENWFTTGQWKTYPQPYLSLSDAARLALVYKLGGIYADLDFLFTDNITVLASQQRWLAQDGGNVADDSLKLNNAIFRLPRGDPFLERWMQGTAECQNTEGNAVPCGPGLETKLWTELCRDSPLQEDKNLCEDIMLLPRILTHKWQWDQYYDLEKPNTHQDWRDAYDMGMQAVHIRRAGTGGECLPRSSALALGFQQGCPAVLEAYGHRMLCRE